jgi:two-component system CheB/CheR fusion protein
LKESKNKGVKKGTLKIAGINKPAHIAQATGKSDDHFPVIGIGASAGGLKAFEEFFSNIPKDKFTGMAFILVQHLAPDHKSILNELIKKYTSMQVFEVTDGITVKPDCIYIIPPNCDMAYLNGRLMLFDVDSPKGKRISIDFFFRSLAQDLNQRAICIILSGTGSDGTTGAKSVKDEGGIVIAQQPESAEYDGMPRSVIALGIVDYVLKPKDMPLQLLSYVNHSYVMSGKNRTQTSIDHTDFLQKILVLIRSKTGNDFSRYKSSTITRRIERRMAVNKIETFEDYLRYLQTFPKEITLLFKDMLIGVTSFFRDKESFKVLEERVIPSLFEGKEENSHIRVWIPGCSTGEEAYSIAILLQEYKNRLNKSFKIQVFATDIDDNAIQIARSGSFSENACSGIDPGALQRYFIKETISNTYVIQKEVRDIIIFSVHNIIKDPPFSKLDLISCRNLLIYFGSELQKRILPIFHYALKPGGYLFLGPSESIGDFIGLYSIYDANSKIYNSKGDPEEVKKKVISQHLPEIKKSNDTSNELSPALSTVKNKTSLRSVIEKELLLQHTPASIIVNGNYDIQYLHGRTGLYLEPAPGNSEMNALKMAREGLKPALISLLQKAASTDEPATASNVKVKSNGSFNVINLTVKQLQSEIGGPNPEKLYLIIFQPAETEHPTKEKSGSKTLKSKKGNKGSDSELENVKKELQEKELYLQSTISAMETSNEELKSINEELQSVNEEFQSTNEELETSREELQSVNEELATVNSELQQKVYDLSRSVDDMNNLLAGTDIGTIFLDSDLRITRFTPAVTSVINLITADVGRPISHIVSNMVGYDSLVQDMQSVLDTLIPKENEIQTKSGFWYILRMRPYRTINNVIEGVVITFFDITEIKKAERAITESENIRHLAIVVMDSSDAVIARDLNGMIISWNPAAKKIYGWNETEALTMNTSKLIPENKLEEESKVLKNLVNSDMIEPYRTQRCTKTGEIIDVIITANALVKDDGSIYAISSTERKIVN